MSEFDQQIISVGSGDRTHQAAYWDCGSGSPVLLLHGFMGNGRNWQFLVPQLQEHYRCVALDLLGFGNSSKPEIRYQIDRLVEFVDDTLSALGIDRCAIVGHSLGGWVAAAYALAHPDRVSALVLVAPAGIRDDSFCGRYDHMRPLLWKTPIVDWALALGEVATQLIGKVEQREQISWLRWLRHELLTQPAARSFIVDRLRPEDAIDTVEQEIHRLQVPTLILAGEQDPTIPLWHCETYAREIAGAKLEILPGADHALPQQYAPQLAAAIGPFLSQAGLPPNLKRVDRPC